jgi:hypothetical protein
LPIIAGHAGDKEWDAGRRDAVPGQIAIKRLDEKSANFLKKKRFFLAIEAQPLFCGRGVSPAPLAARHRG